MIQGLHFPIAIGRPWEWAIGVWRLVFGVVV